jgi:hypothetical protein
VGCTCPVIQSIIVPFGDDLGGQEITIIISLKEVARESLVNVLYLFLYVLFSIQGKFSLGFMVVVFKKR